MPEEVEIVLLEQLNFELKINVYYVHISEQFFSILTIVSSLNRRLNFL